MNATPRTIALCADDYALHPAVDAGVQQLAELGRLSATSCMTTAPRWREAARALPALRQQFLAEHTHGDAEIRFFLGGAGLFYIRRADGGAFGLLCEATDWVAIPAGARHWFDAGEQPDFDALRLFSTELGWQAQPVPDAPIGQWPLLDEFRTRLLSLSGFHEG